MATQETVNEGLKRRTRIEGATRSQDSVQSLERACTLLDLMGQAEGDIGLSELSDQSGLPLPSVHRLMKTLIGRGYGRQLASRRYTLGPRLIWLGEVASHLLARRARPFLAELVQTTGETANMAMMDGDEVTYVAQVPSKHSMRMFTEVGGHVKAHCTGVGKALLAQLDSKEVEALVARTGMPAKTPHTITDPASLLAELEVIRERGYAVDNGEQEVGVRCIAVPVIGTPTLIAFSVSGPEARMTDALSAEFAPTMKKVAATFAETLQY